ncbi:aminotransferase class V-fold PLP-dependent enzyme [Devosia sp. PTR5]|uniref:Aminotransferase class V-fold PLP-dependent enzyme n=1 Tax=Devosia oryzisoli TaxID=2774138 RepID=A0A927FS24_9HYPH|nr:aminotransferase class V-fold PLP-dependent enzyme [Devosia oryzisoli]
MAIVAVLAEVLGEHAGGDLLAAIAGNIIGKGQAVPGPFGPHPMIYADFVASGRPLQQVEAFIATHVLPWYSNTHTEGSHCGAVMSDLRRQARALIKQEMGAGEDVALIFAGNGATAGLNKLVALLDVGPDTTVLIGPYEHHSNILPWRESGAQVIEVPEAAEGGPDLDWLEATLRSRSGRVIGAFSAASNTTGILTDTDSVTQLLKRHDALAVWDYACAAPYVRIDMGTGAAAKDAIVLSPHKFVGGPGASGVLALRKSCIRRQKPSAPGGGTVRFVSPWDVVYSDDPVAREEAGTPNVIGDIRAGLAFAVKAAVGAETIQQRNAALARRGFDAWQHTKGLTLLGHPEAKRLPIFSFTVTSEDGETVHPQLVTRLLSDLHGIQARGGCSCAGPYGHRLLDIDEDRSARMRDGILSGNEVEKPGWTRLNLSWTMSEAEVELILEAVQSLPADAARVAPSYTIDRSTARARYSA